MVRKIKKSELPIIKDELIKVQGGKYPICGNPLKMVSQVNRVLDHDHDTGFVRGVLCRACNRAEGVVKGAIITYAKAGNSKYHMLKTLGNLLEYWKFHSTPQTGYIYYDHKTEAEKKDARNKKARLVYAKKKEIKGG